MIIRALIVIMAIYWSGHCFAAETPKNDAVVSLVSHQHPRLMISQTWGADLKAAMQSDPWLKNRYATLVTSADRIVTQPASKYEIPDGLRLLATSRQVLERVTTLAAVYRATGDAKYLDRAWAELDAAAKFKDWNPRLFLDTAEMTAAFGLGYDWLYDAWTPELRSELRDAIKTKGLAAGMHVYEHRQDWWPTMHHNWNVVCNGGLAIGALAIADVEPDIAGKILDAGIKSAPNCLREFAPDGGWVEGPGYWGYTTLFESMYLDSLRTATGTAFGLDEFPGMEKGGWFPLYLNGPTGASFNFADAHEGTKPEAGAQLLWMAKRFNEPRYADYQMEMESGRLSALEMVWGIDAQRKPWRTIDTDRYFRRAEIATMRDNWNDPNGWFVGIKAGSNTVNHAHLDVGSFILEAKGVRWLIDLGSDDYNLPAYFGAQRWEYYRLRAEGHNTLVLNPGNAPDQNPKGEGKITSFESNADGVKLSADLTGVYPAAESAIRQLNFDRGRAVTVSDDVKMKAPRRNLVVRTYAHAKVQLGDDGRTALLRQKGQTLKMTLTEPADARIEIRPSPPLDSSPHPARQADDSKVSVITIHLRDRARMPHYCAI